ncbi:hypothetical protein [Lacticaseibacillus pantheris]|uniref:lytic transglycosylase domain-containing protein n=1 Tax=Lacticaseibacillus pantheris TaxID=171523 RepID=UPI001CDABCE4|nr:hypothetical protein [Lacticaseibacillus pantheris]
MTTGATTEVGAAAASTSRGMVLAKGVGNTAGAIAGVGAVIDVGGSIVKSLVNPTNRNKISAASKSTGATIGAGIGATLGSIIPGAGTAAGAGIGFAIGDVLGSTKTAQSWAKAIAKSYHDATAGLKVPSPKIDVDDKALGNSFTKASKALSKKLVVSMSTDPKTLAKSAASVNSTYAKMQKSVDSYYKNKEAASAKDLQKLVNNGQMTQAQADKSLKKQKAADAAEAKSKKATYAAMQKDASAYYIKAQTIANGGTKKLQSIAQKYGKNSEQYEKEKNKELLAAYKSYANSSVKAQIQNNSKITSTVRAGASQQTKLLEKLTKEKGKLSNEQLSNTAKNAKNEYNAAVKPARDARDDIKKAANDRYKSSKAIAEHEYRDSKSITKSQYDDAVKKAQKQRDDTNSAADDQYKKVTKHAYNQYQSVKDAITKQQKAVVEQARQQQVGSNDYAAQQSKSVVNHAIKQANSSMDASSKQARGTGNIFGGLMDWWNKFNKAVGGDEVKTSKGSYNYSQIGGPAYGYASGGSVGATSKALVGEAGPELRYSPYSKTVDVLGAHGAQFADVRSGEYILNAKDTARLMAGTYGGILPGYASGTSGLDDFINKIKSGASNIMDKISDTAVSMFDAITHPVDTLKNLAAKIFDVKSVPKVGTLAQSASGGMRDKTIDWVAKAFTKLKDAVDNSDLKNPSGSGAARWKPYVIKALKANHFEATASQVAAWMRVIQRESNGNPKAINLWDSNAKKGIPSMGLVQTIKPTFEAYKFKGHNDIYNGYDDLLAGIAYMAAKYGRGASAFTRVSGPEAMPMVVSSTVHSTV